MTEKLGLVLAACLVACGAANEGDDGEDTQATALTAPAPFAGDPANGAVFAVDISQWEGPMSQAEMDCFWASGVRHVVVGTQVEEVTRQQLTMAVSRGMTVDGYVYLWWNTDMRAQVETAFARTSGQPIARMWLDIEQSPGGLGATAIVGKIREALTACRAHGIPCGFYTGSGFWRGDAGDDKSFADVPLWYAIYDYRTSLSDWPHQSFGGFTEIVGKQFDKVPLCGVGLDRDVMQVLGAPTVTVDRSLPPDTGLPPPAPTGLYPSDASVDTLGYAKLMTATIPRATSYQLALEHWNGTKWVPYYTWTTPNAFFKTSPVFPNALYRFRARAANAHGWGAWSDYASFDYGRYAGPRP